MSRVRNPPPYLKRNQKYRDAVFLSQSEIDQWKSLLSQPAQTSPSEKARLKALCAERASNFPDTVDSALKKKEEQHRENLRQQEEARQVIDTAEEAYQKEKRRQALERANRILYQQDDRVKNFHSKMQLAAILEERAQQIELKKVKKNREQEVDGQWHEAMKQNMQRAIQAEVDQANITRIKAQENRAMVLQQLGEQHEIRKRAKEEKVVEGRAIRRAAEQALLEEMEEETKRQGRAIQQAADLVQCNAELRKTREVERRLSGQEELRIQRFAELKEQQVKQRREREREIDAKKLEVRQRMIDRQYDHLQSINNERNAREEYHYQQKIESDIKEDDRRKARQHEIFMDLKQQRESQVSASNLRRDQQMAEEKAFVDLWKKQHAEASQREFQDKQAAFLQAQDLHKFRLHQAKEKDVLSIAEKQAELNERVQLERQQEQDEANFKAYIGHALVQDQEDRRRAERAHSMHTFTS